MSPVHHSRCMCGSIYSTCIFSLSLFFFFICMICAHIYILEYIQFQCSKWLLSSTISTMLALPWVTMPLWFNCHTGSSTWHISCWHLRSKKEFFFLMRSSSSLFHWYVASIPSCVVGVLLGPFWWCTCYVVDFFFKLVWLIWGQCLLLSSSCFWLLLLLGGSLYVVNIWPRPSHCFIIH